MRKSSEVRFSQGTDPALIEVAQWRGRFEVTRRLSRGEEPAWARLAIILQFRHDLETESFGSYADESLMAALQRGVEDALVDDHDWAGQIL